MNSTCIQKYFDSSTRYFVKNYFFLGSDYTMTPLVFTGYPLTEEERDVFPELEDGFYPSISLDDYENTDLMDSKLFSSFNETINFLSTHLLKKQAVVRIIQYRIGDQGPAITDSIGFCDYSAGYAAFIPKKLINPDFKKITENILVYLCKYRSRSLLAIYHQLDIEINYFILQELLDSLVENGKVTFDQQSSKYSISVSSSFVTESEWYRWFTTTWFIDLSKKGIIKHERKNNNVHHGAITTPEVMYRLIKLFSNVGDSVFDPFSGTGTTLAVARLLDRIPYGSEINPGYYQLALENFRLNNFSDIVLELGDAFDVLAGMERNSVDLITTSPPYFNRIRYSTGIKGDISFFTDYTDYLKKLQAIITELHRVLKKNGHLAIIIGDSQQKVNGKPRWFDVHSEISSFCQKELGMDLSHMFLNVIPNHSRRKHTKSYFITNCFKSVILKLKDEKSPAESIVFGDRLYPDFDNEFILVFRKTHVTASTT
ncbi:MAG: DNA methyltransferase [Candidatus Odinarchaeota archaeon]